MGVLMIMRESILGTREEFHNLAILPYVSSVRGREHPPQH